MPLQESFFIIKPDGMNHQPEIRAAICDKGLWITRYVIRKIMAEEISLQYEDYINEPFFPYAVDFLTSAPVGLGVAMGNEAIASVRALAGATRPWQAEADTIRARFGTTRSQEEADLERGNIKNAIHASDSPKSVIREAGIYLPDYKITTF